MSKDEVKEKIVKEITGPTKATDMPLLVRTEYDIPMLLSELVKERRIIEIEYVLPQMHYRIKSLYLPIGTKIKVINATH